MPIPDLYTQGIAQGWQVTDATTLTSGAEFSADVLIIGSGAGGATSARILSEAGLRVLIIEEGGLFTSTSFKGDEANAYAQLYQEGAARTTQDGGIGILQGRSVGGSTTVNWTSSFRTPDATLQHWADVHQVKGIDSASLAPWFEQAEQQLGISPWQVPPNANNDVIKSGCEQLRWHWATIPRNVRGCANLGYCGTGCPLNAKQSMLVTSLPAALNAGARLIHRLRAERLIFDGNRVSGVQARAMNATLNQADGASITLRAGHVILAGGGINSPALLLRSQAPDPYNRLGKRTFLHPVNFSFAQFDHRIDGFYGAPQSIYSDQFQWAQGTTGPMGFKLEVPPMQPSITAALLGGHGSQSLARMEQLAYSNLMIALMRDGFHEQSTGGTVILRKDGSPTLDYPLNDFLWQAVRRAWLAMGEIQFAAGAIAVAPVHAHGRLSRNLAEYQAQIEQLSYRLHDVRLASAHVMGGCAMGEDPQRTVTNSQGRHHHISNLSILDGSLFPTSIGANPQLSIYALVGRLASELRDELTA